MDKFQKVVAESYEGGEFNCDEVLNTLRDSSEDIGDSLFEFLMDEISEGEGVDSYKEAVRRLNTIVKQVEEVKIAMEDKLTEEKS